MACIREWVMASMQEYIAVVSVMTAMATYDA